MANAEPWKNKIIKNRFSGLLLLLFIVGLYVFQNKTVIPFVERIVESDLFDADTTQLDGKDRTRIAFAQCNDFVQENLDSDQPVQFSAGDYKSWDLASGRYLIRSYVITQNDPGKEIRMNYACNVQFQGGDDMDHDNWKLQGLQLQDM